jgi:endonuclease/exonuclease/phosphatase family metal-dependent hydrolase
VTAGRTPLTVATYNIRAAIGPGEPFPPAWWWHVRKRRLERIAAILEALDADVVALQEVAVFNVDGELGDQPAELARLTGRHARYAAAGHFPIVLEDGRVAGTSLWGNAILSRLPIRASWAAGLPRAGDDDLVEPASALHPLDSTPHPLAGVRYADAPTGAREPRVVLRVTVEASDGQPVDVLATHFTHVGSGQRHLQAAFVADLAASLDGAVVLAGDLNAPPEAPELEPLTESLSDAFAATGVAAGDAARRSCGPWAIDHLLARGLASTSCRVAGEAGDASDHWPVVATFVAPERASR